MTVLLVLGVAGLLLLLVSLVVGDLFDGVLGALDSDAFSSAALGAFVSALGFGGAIASAAGAPGLVVGVVGVLAGAAFGWLAIALTRLLRRDDSGRAPSAHDTLGRDATVVTPIPAGGFGVVRIHLGGHTVRYNARSDDGSVVEPGTPVHVTGVLSPTAVVVAPTWRELALPEE